jgi:hypothetical protein
MDLVAQRLAEGRWIRVLTVVDQYPRESLTLHADTALSGEEVVLSWMGSSPAAALWRCWMMDSLSMKLDGRSDAIRVL